MMEGRLPKKTDAMIQLGSRKREPLECGGGDDQFLLLTQDCFLTQHVLKPTRGGNVVDLISLLKMN